LYSCTWLGLITTDVISDFYKYRTSGGIPHWYKEQILLKRPCTSTSLHGAM